MGAEGWLEVCLEVAPERQEAVSDLFTDCGAAAVTLQAAGDDQVLEPAAGQQPLWRDLKMSALFEASRDPLELLAAVSPVLAESERRSMQFRTMSDQVWERVWLEHFQPMAFGTTNQLWVCPHEQHPPGPGPVVYLDPGLAFGTGTHATTALCLDRLADQPPVGLSVLDFGCGSGILAIAASRLGADRVTAVDNDPQAVEATSANAARNDCSIRVRSADRFSGGHFDLVIANILAGVLCELATPLSNWVAPGGTLLLSGILTHQQAAVTEAFDARVSRWQVSQRDDWVALIGQTDNGAANPGDHVYPVS